MEKSNKQFINDTSMNLDESRKIVDSKDEEIKKLNELLQIKEQTIQYINITEDQYKQKCSFFSDLCNAKDAEIESIRTKMIEAETRYEDMSLKQKSEGLLLIEIDQLKKDKEKLLSLLKETKEFKGFAEMAEDSKGVVCKGEQWIPEEINKVVQNYFKLGGNVSQEIISQLLKDLNKVYEERERKQIARLKSKLNNEIITLKRQLLSRQSYDTVVAKKKISNLQSHIKSISSVEKKAAQPNAMSSLDDALKLVASLETKVTDLEEQNMQLSEKAKTSDNIANSNEYLSKAKFMEGAEWMCKRILEEIKNAVNSADEIIKEYNKQTQEKDSNSSIDIIHIARTQSWLLVCMLIRNQ